MSAEALDQTESVALVARLKSVTSTACAYFPDEVMAMCNEAAEEIRRLLAVADFEHGFRVATGHKLDEVLGRKP